MQHISILPKAGLERLPAAYPDGFIGVREAAKMLGVSVPHVYTIQKRDPSFPPKCRLGGRCSLWEESALRAWSDIRICEAVEDGHG